MTIDEFMRDIAPKMRPGWVAMDSDNRWNWYNEKPDLGGGQWMYSSVNTLHLHLNSMFDIAPVDDWTQSLRKVGK